MAGPLVPATPSMPPLGEVSGEPLGAAHWADARSSCTGTEPPMLFGLKPGYSFRYEVHVPPGQDPPGIDVQLDEGSRRTFRRLRGQVEGGGVASRLVVHDGQDLQGSPKVFAWAGSDRRFHFPRERCEEERGGEPGEGVGGREPAPPPSAPQPAGLAAPSPVAPFFGGRPLPWWQERLSALRRDGPPELYRLALRRAQAAGLTVTEGQDAAVTVAGRGAP